MSGSSWNDGTTTEVDVRKPLSIGFTLAERTARYSQSSQTIVPAMAIGKYGASVASQLAIASVSTVRSSTGVAERGARRVVRIG